MIGTAKVDRPVITAALLKGAASVLTPTTHSTLSSKRLLLVGAGGIGCELLKNLVLSGFTAITVIDMDTVELSNLNRQFLFTRADIGGYKAQVACRAIRDLYPGLHLTSVEARVGNVKDMSVRDFCQFDVVVSALDNLEARRHVNLMAVMANVPVVESGTAGFSGQVGLWCKGRECFDCRHHSPPTTFPVCTIRATPTQMIHCIVWAKEFLLPRLYKSAAADDDQSGVDQRVLQVEDERVREQLMAEESAFESIKQEPDDEVFAKRLVQKLYRDDIYKTMENVDMWTGKAVQPTPLDCLDSEPFDYLNHDRMAMLSTKQQLHAFQQSAIKLRHRPPPQIFDKDDDTMMSFVASAANLRAATYHCQPESVSSFKAKEMAGNIIPAVATTNAIAASLASLLAIRCAVGDYCGACNVYITHGSANRVLTREALQDGQPDCAVCNTTRLHVHCDIDVVTMEQLMDACGVECDGDGDVMVLHGGRLLYDSVDMPSMMLSRSLRSYGIDYGDCIGVQTDSPVMIAILPHHDKNGDNIRTVVINTARPQPVASGKRDREDSDDDDAASASEAKAIRIDDADTDDLVVMVN